MIRRWSFGQDFCRAFQSEADFAFEDGYGVNRHLICMMSYQHSYTKCNIYHVLGFEFASFLAHPDHKPEVRALLVICGGFEGRLFLG